MSPLAHPRWIYRFPIAVRVSRWANAVCLGILVMSGLQIFNAHPALYWGEDSDFDRPCNVLQKLAYLSVTVVVGPLIVLTGLAMSPAVDAAVGWLPDVFGGRQSARTIHFVATGLFILLVVVHVAMVLVTGVWNNLRSMITGWYGVSRDGLR
jgi:thiosulfate reductase cytochrome b subunit